MARKTEELSALKFIKEMIHVSWLKTSVASTITTRVLKLCSSVKSKRS